MAMANKKVNGNGNGVAAKRAALEASPRPFRNHYSGGMHLGACGSAQSAMVAAFKHLVFGEAGAATIVAPDDRDVARMHWTSVGISVWAPPDHYKRPKGAEPTKPILRAAARAILSRVK
jgi:hypothetical protein